MDSERNQDGTVTTRMGYRKAMYDRYASAFQQKAVDGRCTAITSKEKSQYGV